jgi:hypothetical protein
MGKKRLFKVTVMYFVAAENRLEAANVAPTMKESDVEAKEVEGLAEIPEDWRLAYPKGDCSRLCGDYFRGRA